MSLQVSVVVPTFRRPALLDGCLQSLLAQDFPPTAYEVIVVDDGCEEATRRLVESESARARACGVALRYLAAPVARRGPAAARNLGWQAARGPLIAFTDDDCRPAAGWLEQGAAALADGAAGASGRVVVPLPPRPSDYERDVAGLERSLFVTANCFYRRSALQAAGGFDERFAIPWREDSDLYFRLLRRGERLVPAPDAVVVHPVRAAGWGVSLRQQRKSMYNALLYKKHPRLYRQVLQPAPPWRYYLSLAALAGALGGGLAGAAPLALLSAVSWAALTLHFSALRLRGASHSPGHVAEMLVTSALIPLLSVYWRLRGALKFRVFFL